MKDVLVIAIVIGFFAVCAAYVTWCERVLAADAPDRVARDATRRDASPSVEPTVRVGAVDVRH